jgi:hypothetical protein
LNLSAPNVMVVIILAKINQNYPTVVPTSWGGYLGSSNLGFLIPYPSNHCGSLPCKSLWKCYNVSQANETIKKEKKQLM